ncbi:MAG TPA: hypothetical protein VH187_13545 [Scandinavium sp.]|jgi:hypothetical protein|uniref:hypothetical protein n=1 Tax=Scandinavium sp. TaxID=2830653 RepID=UPI002E3789C5|nr:hypothetical protein [Scandinavium sp.]HEX4502155.1 hypothetical protein [Scandinavium sp.]
MPKTVAILGCGPAGLLAAHAARLMGCDITIISNKRKSSMLGAQYMHRAIPELDLNPPVKLSYVLQGNVDDYRAKVYGDDADESITVSPELFQGYHEAWSIRQAYNQLWKRYQAMITDDIIDQEYLLHAVNSYDATISTIPAKQLCYQRERHMFTSVKVWIDNTWRGGDVERNKDRYGTRHVVLCNGQSFDEDHPSQTGWYRTSIIYDHANTEWASDAINIFMPHGVMPVIKPLQTNCDCWPGIVRAGRYGLWQKGILSHDAFEMALGVL